MMSETFRTSRLSDIVDIIDDPKTNSIVCHGKQFDLVKHGRWIRNDNGTYSCSECKSWIPNEQHYYARYCLFCGAKMDEVRVNDSI